MLYIRAITAAALLLAGPALAQEPIMQQSDQAVTYTFDGDFDDATFAVETAIIGRGLVIDYVSHAGEMLERTRADMGSEVVLFDAADIFMFCSASVSRKVMEADPMNIAFCPYSIFVTAKDGETHVGYRKYPEGPMQIVQSMLDDIVKKAVSD